ncbi:MAG TPA: hypothetical protein VF790_00795 [Dissulfurispiraceae bacterium]
MKINIELIVGLVLTLASAFYWATIGNSMPVNEVPLAYRYTYRLYPYLDVAFTGAGMLIFYRGLLKLRE